MTESNAPAFLSGLDLLVEECDSLDMKHQIRQRAKERGIDLVYAADERGFLSIEPYSRHDLPIFHGLATAPDQPYLQGLTAWLGGWNALSDRSQRSVERIGTTLTGYPPTSRRSPLRRSPSRPRNPPPTPRRRPPTLLRPPRHRRPHSQMTPNVFGNAWPLVLSAAHQLFPAQPILGYEHGDDLNHGFEPIGPLRVWLH